MLLLRVLQTRILRNEAEAALLFIDWCQHCGHAMSPSFACYEQIVQNHGMSTHVSVGGWEGHKDRKHILGEKRRLFAVMFTK